MFALSLQNRYFEQPEAIARALQFGSSLSFDRVMLGGFSNDFERCSKIKHMTLSACGTSLNAAKYAETLMKHLECFESVCVVDSTDENFQDFPRAEDPEVRNLSSTLALI